MATKVYAATALTGGGAGALDAIDGSNLLDKDIALVGLALDSTLFYALDDDSGAAESSPAVISPDANAGNKRWILLGFKMGGKSIILDLDGDTSITADTDDQIDFACSAADQIRIVDGKLVPAVDNDIDLGDSTHEFKDLYVDGTANIDSLVADTADINGGTADSVIIGGAVAAAITCTTLTTGGKLTAGANEVEGSLFDIDGGAMDGVTLGAASVNTYSDLMPAGTVMMFAQNSAPTGWTRLTTGDGVYDTAADNAMVCFAKTGNTDRGGGVDPQATHTHTGPSHTHTGPSHAHNGNNHVHQWYNFVAAGSTAQSYNSGGSAQNLTAVTNEGGIQIALGTATGNAIAADQYTTESGVGDTGAGGTGNTGAGGTAATGANTAPYYLEVILAKKN